MIKAIPNIRVTKMKDFLDMYSSIIEEANLYPSGDNPRNGTIKIMGEYIKIFTTEDEKLDSLTFYFSKDNRKEIDDFIKKIEEINKSKCEYYEESASGYFFASIKDEFNVEWYFQRYDVNVPTIFNVYSSQFTLLSVLGYNNLIEREQREGNYFIGANSESMTNKIKTLKFNEPIPAEADFVVVDELDLKYNSLVKDYPKDKIILTNYGWNDEGVDKYDYKNDDFHWTFKNDPYKQHMFLVNNLDKAGILDNKELAIKIVNEQNEKLTKTIQSSSEIISKKYKGKNIGFVFFWQSDAHYFDSRHFNSKNIVLQAPSWLPEVYDEFGFEFPSCGDKTFVERTFNKYGVVDFKNHEITMVFKNKFDIIIYVENRHHDYKNLDLTHIKSMLTPKGKMITVDFDDFNQNNKCLWGKDDMINKLTEVLE